MKLDLGIVQFEVPQEDVLVPNLVVGIGREDKQKSLSAGPTLAKSVSHSYQRTLSATFRPVEPSDMAGALESGLNELVKRTGNGKVRKTEDIKLNGNPAKRVEIAHKAGDKTPVVTRAAIYLHENFLQLVVLTSLDDPRTNLQVEKQFMRILTTLKPGSYFNS